MPDVYRLPLPPNASLRTANGASEGITGIGHGVLLDRVVLLSQILYLWKSIFGHSFLSMYVSYKFLFTNTSLISLSTFMMIDDNTCNYCGKMFVFSYNSRPILLVCKDGINARYCSRRTVNEGSTLSVLIFGGEEGSVAIERNWRDVLLLA